ncbi:MAG: hypothetical protein M0007_02090 [Actinomycetota bacterium]|nr:hypothetical protein [Actinomycetota bacterium]
MSDDELDKELLKRVPMDRRAFIRRAVIGAAFAVPVVASFTAGELAGDHRAAATPEPAFVSNQEVPPVDMPVLGHRGYVPYAYHPYQVGLDD